MNPGDPIIWTDSAGAEQAGIYIGRHGNHAIAETVTPSGHLGLRYVDFRDMRPAGPPSEVP